MQSAVRSDGTFSDYFLVNTAVRQGCVLVPTFFYTCIDHELGRMWGKSSCGVSFARVRITDFDFADDAFILVKTTQVLADALSMISMTSLRDQDEGPGVQ